MTEPHKPERVKEIQRLVTIGDDLNAEQTKEVRKLIGDFADIFALSVSEVKMVDNAVHHLDLPPDATFPLKVHQKPLTPPQRRYLYESIDTIRDYQGNPGVSRANPDPYLSKPTPAPKGMGFYGYRSGFPRVLRVSTQPVRG